MPNDHGCAATPEHETGRPCSAGAPAGEAPALQGASLFHAKLPRTSRAVIISALERLSVKQPQRVSFPEGGILRQADISADEFIAAM